MVSRLDSALPNGLLEGERDGGTRRVAVLVDVDRDLLQRQADPARRRVDDPEVRLVWDPQVDVVEGDPGRRANLVSLADEDVDGELEDVRADHVDVRRRVLRRVGALLDVAAGHLGVAPPVRAETPALEAGSLRSHLD